MGKPATSMDLITSKGVAGRSVVGMISRQVGCSTTKPIYL
jgi:hypothetical protein